MGTPKAVQILREAGIDHRLVEYGPVRSAEEAARARGIALGALVKTLVIRRGEDDYVLVLIPADRSLSYPKLRTALGVRRLTMPGPEEAKAATGYERGTITPLGAGHWITVVDESLTGLDEISLGSGVGGLAIHVSPQGLMRVISHRVADVSD